MVLFALGSFLLVALCEHVGLALLGKTISSLNNYLNSHVSASLMHFDVFFYFLLIFLMVKSHFRRLGSHKRLVYNVKLSFLRTEVTSARRNEYLVIQ